MQLIQWRNDRVAAASSDGALTDKLYLRVIWFVKSKFHYICLTQKLLKTRSPTRGLITRKSYDYLTM